MVSVVFTVSKVWGKGMSELKTLCRKLAYEGCPYYISNDASRTRQGRAICFYCDEVVEEEGAYHAEDCLWLEVLKGATE